MTDAVIFIKEIWRGKDLYRIFMNLECRSRTLKGRVLDVGSGLNKASYHRFFRKADDAEVVALDLGFGSAHGGSPIDLERDSLPHADHSADMVLIFNVLEHIYNHTFLLSEIRKTLKTNGRVFGAVPFLVGYHPDPRDYRRYTSEALSKMFDEQGFHDIEIKVLGRGPMCAAYAQIEFMLPRIVKIMMLPCVFFLDKIIFMLKPHMSREKFALGLFFSFSA
ncbi:MAG: methyltransferase domain-containing protein [Patescibacteria group bacterium]